MRFEAEGIGCAVLSSGEGGPVIYACIFPEQDAEELFAETEKRCAGEPFTLVCFRPASWRSDCAPWTAQIDGESWIGAADGMLQTLETVIIPRVCEMIPDNSCTLIAGYSMAGLFALWAMYRTDAFAGCAACSASLWYPGWDTFTAENGILKEGAAVYLSIGGKESRGAPPYMACIDERMRLQTARMKKDKNVRESILEMNPGGHFASPNGRLAKGIAWLIAHTKA